MGSRRDRWRAGVSSISRLPTALLLILPVALVLSGCNNKPPAKIPHAAPHNRAAARDANPPLTWPPARLAIVIDDLGQDRAQADTLFRLHYPLTLSVLPSLAGSTQIANEAHRRGFQVLLHLPMSSTRGEKEELTELRPGMDSQAVEQTFNAMLTTVPYAAGVNNHQGSLSTADRTLMNELMPLLRERHLFFVDSRTTPATVAEHAARTAGVQAASRNIFLDDDPSAGAIRRQFDMAVRDAREKGFALAIGHPYAETVKVLAEQLPSLGREGITLVFASELVR